MSDSIEKIVAEMRRASVSSVQDELATFERLNDWADRLDYLRQGAEGDPVAWTVVGHDGKSSIGGWSDMSSHRVMSEIGILRDGHRYAYAYEANPAPPTSDDDSPRDVSWWVRRLKDQEAITDRLAARVAELEATHAQAGAELPELSAVERQALQGILSIVEHDAGDTDDLAPSIVADEDAYWAWHAYHGLTKLLAGRGGS